MRWHEMVKKGEVAHESRRPTRPEHIPVSVASLKQIRVLLLPPGVLEAPPGIHRRVTLQQYVAGAHFLYTWVERDNVG